MILVITGIALPLVIGSLFWMHEYRLSVLQQLRLDRCTSEMALQFKASILKIETLNLQIMATRLAIMEASATPPVRASLQTLLESLAFLERGILARWKLKSAQWMTHQLSCLNTKDHLLPAPGLPFQMDPPDSIGSQPLRFVGNPEASYRFVVHHSPRYSIAKVEKSHEKARSWSARWTSFN